MPATLAPYHILGRYQHLALGIAVAVSLLCVLLGCAAKPALITDQPIAAVNTTPPGVPYVQYTFYWGGGGSTKLEYQVREVNP